MLQKIGEAAAYEWTKAPDDLEDPIRVFRALFSDLPALLEIRPSENVFYLRFGPPESPFTGSFSLRLRESDRGTLGFSYRRQNGNPARTGYYWRIGPKEGLRLEQVDSFTYLAELQGRTVDIHLGKLRIALPVNARLRPNERYVGPCYDESGLLFALLFDEESRRFLWILDESGGAPESFQKTAECLQTGQRTGFVFFDDADYGRRVLVGVARSQVEANTWFDGPFDQLPDNYIATGEVELQRFIELAQPDRRGQVDKFGYFKMLRGSRVAIAPYIHYRSPADLEPIDRIVRRAPSPDAYRQLFQALPGI